jgi:hypothetical protein
MYACRSSARYLAFLRQPSGAGVDVESFPSPYTSGAWRFGVWTNLEHALPPNISGDPALLPMMGLMTACRTQLTDCKFDSTSQSLLSRFECAHRN